MKGGQVQGKKGMHICADAPLAQNAVKIHASQRPIVRMRNIEIIKRYGEQMPLIHLK